MGLLKTHGRIPGLVQRLFFYDCFWGSSFCGNRPRLTEEDASNSERFIGFNKISHENIRGKRAAIGGSGLNASVPAIIKNRKKVTISMRWSRFWQNMRKRIKRDGGVPWHCLVRVK